MSARSHRGHTPTYYYPPIPPTVIFPPWMGGGGARTLHRPLLANPNVRHFATHTGETPRVTTQKLNQVGLVHDHSRSKTECRRDLARIFGHEPTVVLVMLQTRGGADQLPNLRRKLFKLKTPTDRFPANIGPDFFTEFPELFCQHLCICPKQHCPKIRQCIRVRHGTPQIGQDMVTWTVHPTHVT